MTRPRPPTYREQMSQDDAPAEPDVMQMFDTEGGPGLTCRVCGSLVSSAGEYPRAHWDWHEATNGA
jgi:hypothetical protein